MPDEPRPPVTQFPLGAETRRQELRRIRAVIEDMRERLAATHEQRHATIERARALRAGHQPTTREG